VIDAWLIADRDVHRKQRHTARLCGSGWCPFPVLLFVAAAEAVTAGVRASVPWRVVGTDVLGRFGVDQGLQDRVPPLAQPKSRC
jgi:hypothetical protein